MQPFTCFIEKEAMGSVGIELSVKFQNTHKDYRYLSYGVHICDVINASFLTSHSPKYLSLLTRNQRRVSGCELRVSIVTTSTDEFQAHAFS